MQTLAFEEVFAILLWLVDKVPHRLIKSATTSMTCERL